VSGLVVSGTLTAHGTAAPVTLTVTAVSSEPGTLRCRATTRIDRYAFGVTTGRGVISRYLDVELDTVHSGQLTGTQQPNPGYPDHRGNRQRGEQAPRAVPRRAHGRLPHRAGQPRPPARRAERRRFST
jgi:hypothetical protein